MLSLYEILKASKTGIAPDMWTALAGKNWNGTDTGHEVKELTGIPPLSFTANGQPLLDCLISGNMEQSGTPTSTTPIQPQECGERTGNLFDKSKRADNSRVVYTTGEINALNGIFVSDYTPIEPNTTYTLNIVTGITGKTGHLFALYDENKNFVDTGTHEATAATVYTFTTPSNVAYIRFNGNMASVDSTMLNTGSTLLPYEPYGYKIPISSASTTTPVYLGEVETTRQIRKLVLTGEEAFTYSSQNDNRYVCSLTYSTLNMSDAIGICSHFVWKRNYEPTVYNRIVRASNTAFYLSLANDLLDEVSTNGFKAYLAAQYAAGTPVTIWYVLATPETGIVNEPLRKIGNYADTLSYEQAGVQIPTNRGNTVIDVLTELKPSEMYIKYQE